MPASRDQRLVVILLRLACAATICAFPAMLLPVEWMAATHEWLGMGEFPRSAVIDYLARSIAGLYGFHGVLLLLISRDPVRYHAIVRYAGWMNVLFGVAMVAIDLHAGMPRFWTLGEGPPIVVLGSLILYCSRSLRPR